MRPWNAFFADLDWICANMTYFAQQRLHVQTAFILHDAPDSVYWSADEVFHGEGERIALQQSERGKEATSMVVDVVTLR